jgi:hypothetical protein
MHDQTAVKTEGIDTLLNQFPQVKFEMDSGYGGLRRDHPAQVSIPPRRPAKDAPASAAAAWEQARHAQSPARICVEHAIADSKHLAAPATLDRTTRRPARNHPGHRLTGLRPGRCLVKPEPSRRQARTPRT